MYAVSPQSVVDGEAEREEKYMEEWGESSAGLLT
jgi:hypothetical protein